MDEMRSAGGEQMARRRYFYGETFVSRSASISPFREVTNMFLGEYQHVVDDKGRISIPAKFRTALKGGAVVTRGLDRSLVVYAMREWKILAEKLASLPISEQNSRAIARLMLAGAMDVAVDGQGRIAVPEYLRQYAGLKKSVVVAGLYNRLEIWDGEAWSSYKNKTEGESNAIAENLSALGI